MECLSASTKNSAGARKTQASLPSQDSVLLLLFGLLRSGQVTLRALVGYHDMDMAQVK